MKFLGTPPYKGRYYSGKMPSEKVNISDIQIGQLYIFCNGNGINNYFYHHGYFTGFDSQGWQTFSNGTLLNPNIKCFHPDSLIALNIPLPSPVPSSETLFTKNPPVRCGANGNVYLHHDPPSGRILPEDLIVGHKYIMFNPETRQLFRTAPYYRKKNVFISFGIPGQIGSSSINSNMHWIYDIDILKTLNIDPFIFN